MRRTAGCSPVRAAVIDAARTLAFQIGFGRIHKAGYLAAAGIVALETMVDRLADDHRRARRLGEALARIDGLTSTSRQSRPTSSSPAWTSGSASPETAEARLRSAGVGVMAMPGGHIRAVVHRGDRRRRHRDRHRRHRIGPRSWSRSPARRRSRRCAERQGSASPGRRLLERVDRPRDPLPRQAHDVGLGRTCRVRRGSPAT